MYDKNPIIKKTIIPFKELTSLRVPYAGNCAPDHEKLNVKGNCNCDCDCDCHCDCYYTQDCACDCEQSFCDCNCVCDCGGWREKGVLVIPDGAQRIFADTYREKKQIKEVILPEGLKVIGKRAFFECNMLEKINLPEGLEKIGGEAFRHTSLREVIIPDSVTELEGDPFYFCRELKRVRIGKGVKSIGDVGIFTGCVRLEAIEVDEENPYFKSVDGALLSKDGKTFYAYPCGRREEEYSVPVGVTTIGKYAFSESHVKRIVLPYLVRWICYNAFYDAKLSWISFPSTLTDIANYAFAGCQNLTDIEFRGTRAEFHVKVESSWCFCLNRNYERPNLRTEDGFSWSM